MKRPVARGYLLLELIISLAIIGLAMTWVARQQIREAERQEMGALGTRMAEYASGVAQWLVAQGAGATPGIYTGVDWLRTNATCGGSANGSGDYLPCNFPAAPGYGLIWNATVNNLAGATSANLNLGSVNSGGTQRNDLGALAINVANDKISSSNFGVFATWRLDTVNGDLLADVSLPNPAAQPFLRVDGSNGMLAPLQMNNNPVVNLAGGNLTGTLDAGNNPVNNIGGASMSGPLDMGGNSVANAGNVFAFGNIMGNRVQTLAGTDLDRVVLLTATVESVGTVPGSSSTPPVPDRLQIPSCPAGLSPVPTASIINVSRGNPAEPLESIQATVTTAGTFWHFHLWVTTTSSGGTVEIDPDNGVDIGVLSVQVSCR